MRGKVKDGLFTGLLFGKRYQLGRQIGSGGFGEVYSGTDDSGRPVAVKVLDVFVRRGRRHPGVEFQFRLERSIADKIQHSGIVQVLDEGVDEDSGVPFIVMEHLDGSDLGCLLSDGRCVDYRSVVAIATSLLDTLRAVHLAGVIHCDVKPANVFLTKTGNIKLLDFGLSNVATSGFRREKYTTASLGFPGTPEFCPPEVATGNALEKRPSIDVYGVGATMFALMTGRAPHSGENDMQIIYHAATMPVPALQQLAPGVPAPIAAIVDRALSMDPCARWTDATEMMQALAEVTNSSEGHANPLENLLSSER